MKYSRSIAVTLSALILSACASLTPAPKTDAAEALKAGQYRLDPDHAVLLVRISHFGLSDYTGRFEGLGASLDFEQDNPAAARLSASVSIDSLNVNNPDFKAELMDSDWFDAAQFPMASLTLDGVTQMGPASGRATGQLTMRGVTQPVIWDIDFSGGARNPLTQKYTIGFAARAKIKRSDFGMDKYLSIAGDKFDFDTVSLEFNGEFQKQ